MVRRKWRETDGRRRFFRVVRRDRREKLEIIAYGDDGEGGIGEIGRGMEGRPLTMMRVKAWRVGEEEGERKGMEWDQYS